MVLWESSMQRGRRLSILTILAILVATSGAQADAIDQSLAVISASGPNAKGSAEARRACDALSQLGVGAIPRLLAAMDTQNPVAANWYRQAFETIIAREFVAG